MPRRLRSRALAAPPALALALAAATIVLGPASTTPARALEVGYNQAWIGQAYGHDLTKSFEAAALDRVMQRAREQGGRVVRLWLFEGREKEGIVYQGGVPAGVDPALLRGMAAAHAAARRHGVLVYWTLFDGNWFWPRQGASYHQHWNLLNDRYGVRDAFEVVVLPPVLDQMAQDADVVWGLDLVNEVQGMVATWDFSEGWTGARAFIRALRACVRAHAPWLRVTSSSGHHTGAKDLLDGRFSGLGLDFFDVHAYSDQGRIPEAARLRAFARREGRALVLGELGQKTARRDDALQSAVTRAFIVQAWLYGFQAALCWRLDDERQDPAWTAHHSYFWQGRPRPAAAVVRELAPLVRAPSPWWWR